MKILITICSRGGSKGIPGKNIKLLNGKSLIAYSIDTANQFKEKYKNVTIVLSTDSEEIKNRAVEFGLITNYKRPDILSGDTIGKLDAIIDVLKWQEHQDNCTYNYVLDLDVTSPLRNLEDLSNAFEVIQNNKEALNLFSVSLANRNPYFNMVEQKENGFYSLVKQIEETMLTRQSAPKVYDMNGSFYFYKRAFFEKDFKGAITQKSLVYEVPHVCFDLDYPIDFDFMSHLLANNKLDFNL